MAQQPKIKLLNIRALRGIPDLTLQLDGSGMVLEGANGSGKSSIVDALEFLLLGSISHLEGTQTLSVARHGKHVHAKESDVFVQCRLSDDSIIARRMSGAPQVTGSGIAYLGHAQHRTFLLRRAELLNFIHADPADRFRALAGLIGVGQLDELELTFKHANDQVRGQLKAERSHADTVRRELQQVSGLDDDQMDVASVLEAVNAELATVQRPPVATLTEANAVARAAVDSTSVTERTRRVVEAENLLGILRQAAASANALRQTRTVYERVLDFRAQEGVRESLAASRIYEASRAYFQEYAPAICPICERPVEASAILEGLRSKLGRLAELTEAASDIRKDAASAASALERLRTSLADIRVKGAGVFEESVDKALAATGECISEILRSVKRGDLLLDAPVRAMSEAESEATAALIAECQKEVKARLVSLQPTEAEKRLADAVTKVIRLQQLHQDLDRTLVRICRQSELARRATVAMETLVGAKNEVVSDVYAAIKGDMDRFYEMLHPAEHHINITLDISRRASTGLWMDSFERAREDPRAFSSEGHLDSLGLCIFLAFANTFRGECSVLILDDVVMSIDSGHRSRIAELLMTEFEDFQLLVLTHDRIWFRELVQAQKQFGRSGDFKNLRILGWSLTAGPALSDFKPAWEVATGKIEAGDLPGAGADTRRNLEWTLQEIAERLQAVVPFQREPRYTVDVLYQPVRQRLVKLVPHELGDILTKLEASQMFGNLLAHATEYTDAVAKEEVVDFAATVQHVHDWFCCRSCCALMGYDQGAKLILCRNPKCSSRTVWNCKS